MQKHTNKSDVSIMMETRQHYRFMRRRPGGREMRLRKNEPGRTVESTFGPRD